MPPAAAASPHDHRRGGSPANEGGGRGAAINGGGKGGVNGRGEARGMAEGGGGGVTEPGRKGEMYPLGPVCQRGVAVMVAVPEALPTGPLLSGGREPQRCARLSTAASLDHSVLFGAPQSPRAASLSKSRSRWGAAATAAAGWASRSGHGRCGATGPAVGRARGAGRRGQAGAAIRSVEAAIRSVEGRGGRESQGAHSGRERVCAAPGRVGARARGRACAEARGTRPLGNVPPTPSWGGGRRVLGKTAGQTMRRRSGCSRRPARGRMVGSTRARATRAGPTYAPTPAVTAGEAMELREGGPMT